MLLRDLYRRHRQSLWLDDLSRDLLASGRLARMVRLDGLRGETSNPTTFEKAIARGGDYDVDIARLADAGRSPEEITTDLMVADVAAAADVLRPVHGRTGGADGFVSLEMNPAIAHDADATIATARELFGRLGRPNVMIKVPGTLEGIAAVEALISTGVNVNITLLFSVERYEAVAQAFLRGLERRPGDVRFGSRSVASFFVSRVDTKVDALLLPGSSERGLAAVANAKLAYERFERTFSTPRWEAQLVRGACVQRPLWASTGVKDPAYPKTRYFDALVAPNTVATLPEDLILLLRSRDVELPVTIRSDVTLARELVERIPEFPRLMDELVVEGLEKFQKSWDGFVRMVTAKAELRRAV